MSTKAVLDNDTRCAVLKWAAERDMVLNVSLLTEGRTCVLRSHFIRFDPDQSVAQIAYPTPVENAVAAEISVGDKLGLSFRRSHKKCIFVGTVMTRCRETSESGEAVDTLVVRVPGEIRELQRRAYQRIVVPPENFIAVKIWQGGMGGSIESSSWPVCAGRVSNISLGGLLVDIRSDQNPRLGVGDIVGIEITPLRGSQPIVIEGQYRHCTTTDTDRIGLGLQFLGLEHEIAGRTPIGEVADFVKSIQILVNRGGRCGRG